MDQPITIKKSADGLWAQAVALGLVALAFAAGGTLMLGKLASLGGRHGVFLKLLIWAGLAAAWLIGVAGLWMRRKSKHYELTAHALVIHDRVGLFGSVRSEHRYDSVTSLHLRQGYLGKRFGYGDIHVGVIDADREVVLRDIDHPAEQIKTIQSRVAMSKVPAPR